MAAALEIMLQDWRERLRAWAADGSLASAARHALELGAEDPPLLTELTSQWAEADFSGLPPIVLLPASSMPGAAGAYAISKGRDFQYVHQIQHAIHLKALCPPLTRRGRQVERAC